MKIINGIDYYEARYKTEKILFEPWLILIRRWFNDRCPAMSYIYGSKTQMVSTHFSWHDVNGCFVQCVSMDKIACYGDRLSLRSLTNNLVSNLHKKCISITTGGNTTDDLVKLVDNICDNVPSIRGIAVTEGRGFTCCNLTEYKVF